MSSAQAGQTRKSGRFRARADTVAVGRMTAELSAVLLEMERLRASGKKLQGELKVTKRNQDNMLHNLRVNNAANNTCTSMTCILQRGSGEASDAAIKEAEATKRVHKG